MAPLRCNSGRFRPVFISENFLVFHRWTHHLFAALLTLLLAAQVHALTPQEAQAIAAGDTDARITALNQAILNADGKTAEFIQALADDAVKVTATHVFIVRGDKGFDPVTGAEVKVHDDAEDVINNNLMRGALDTAQAALNLFSPDRQVRAAAVQVLLKEPDASRLPLIEKAIGTETDEKIKVQLTVALATTRLASDDKAQRLQATTELGHSRSPDIKLLLNQRLQEET